MTRTTPAGAMRHIASAATGLLLCFGTAAAIAASVVPLGGNAYVTQASKSGAEVINDTGLHNWSSAQAVVSTYVYVQQPGTLQLALDGALKGASHSRVRVGIGSQSRTVDLYASGTFPVAVGSFHVDRPGYVKVDLQGVSTDGGYFGDITGLQINGAAAQQAVFANDPENFYWSRRGPSVHLSFDVPDDTEYFYSEITVPLGQDPVGTYYMANGFDGGYFGFQVNTPKQRTVLFSVWDSPTAPTTLVRKGAKVITNGFGGEGTGGQSRLMFSWEPGKTYRFLTRAQPDGNGNLLYSAWFGLPTDRNGKPKDDGWKFIATWKYHGASAYPRSMYSFLENFNPDVGHVGRRALYGNQWAISTGGTWTDMTRATFTVDATGRNRQRLDFAGGLQGDRFYMRNDGFFSQTVAPDQSFTRAPAAARPVIDFDQLP
jgi:hypothetical protein